MGIKATYGYNSQDAKIIGAERNMETRDIILGAGEHISKAQIKYSNCVEFVRLVTNRGRVLELGNKDSALQLITSYPNKPTGFLAAIRGYEEYHAMASGASLRGPMRTLQFVWANCNAVGSGAVARPAVPHNTGFKAPATPARAPAAKAAARPAAPPAAEPFYEDPTPAEGPADGGTATEADAAAAADAGAAGGAALPSCPAQLDMCAPDASSTSTAYCPVLSPFTSAACVGGCCASSGKCTSSSCAISGVGQEVPNTICYGLNPAIAIGASPNCRGLACKLAIPGCTSDLLGGSCLGSVVDLSGSAAADNPAGAALVGYPCLDVTPSDKTLTAEGKLSLSGEYVAKLWSICDCQAPATIGSTNIPVPHLGKLNITDITSLVNALKPSVNGGEGAGKGLQGVLEALKSKLPSMVVPDGASAANLTNALGFLGSLVGKGGGAAGGGGSPAAGIADLVKGASALAAAANSTNPLGSLLGALAAPGANGGNPLAGLGNLVSALAPQVSLEGWIRGRPMCCTSARGTHHPTL
ncbi:MAG: hypothetical protein J3K34DRAFT_193576 [Monoraphidium minutum]|nr:MAG: hypothetical protein J3K34DRAFT_193576 [Monoraphidium minutum]